MSESRAFSLNDLMEDLSDDGVRDSSGVFTLDPKEAERKLATFALANPQDYILKLVQAAVAAGAGAVEVEARTGEVEVRWDGPGLAAHSLPGLMGHLLSAGCPPETRHLRHLAAGLRGSVGVKPRSLRVESGSGGGGFRRSWDGDGWKDEPLPQRESSLTQVYLARDLGSIFSEWGAELGAMVRGRRNRNHEEEALLAACGYLPVPISINEELVPRASFGQARYPTYKIEEDEFPGECRPPGYLVASDQDSYVEGKVHRRHHLIETQLVVGRGSLPPLGPRLASLRVGAEPATGQRCRSWIALESELSPRARVSFVDDGVMIAQEVLDSPVPGLVAVISVEELAKDLTGLQLVKDGAYRAALDVVMAEAAKLRDQLLERLEDIPIRETVQKTFLK